MSFSLITEGWKRKNILFQLRSFLTSAFSILLPHRTAREGKNSLAAGQGEPTTVCIYQGNSDFCREKQKIPHRVTSTVI